MLRLLPAAVVVVATAWAVPASGVTAAPVTLSSAAVGTQSAQVIPGYGPGGSTVYATGVNWPAGDSVQIDSCAGVTGLDCGVASGVSALTRAGVDGGFSGVPVEVPTVSPAAYVLFHFQDLAPGRAAVTFDVPFTVTGATPPPPPPQVEEEPSPSWCLSIHGPWCQDVDALGCLSWWCPYGEHWPGGHWRGRPPHGRWLWLDAGHTVPVTPPTPPSDQSVGGRDHGDEFLPPDRQTPWPGTGDGDHEQGPGQPTPQSTPYPEQTPGRYPQPPPDEYHPPTGEPTPAGYPPPQSSPPPRDEPPPPPPRYQPPPTQPPHDQPPPPPPPRYQPPPPPPPRNQPPPPPPPRYQPPPPPPPRNQPPPPPPPRYQPPPPPPPRYEPPPQPPPRYR